MLSVSILYMFFINILGFATTTFTLLIITIFSLNKNQKRNIYKIIGVSFLITTVIYIIFVKVLNIFLPNGILL